jgi:hypothetical protein
MATSHTGGCVKWQDGAENAVLLRLSIAYRADSAYVVEMSRSLPELYAVSCVGDRWVAVWPSHGPHARGFDRREMLPSERLHVGDENPKPPVLINRNRPRRALRAVCLA